MFNYTSLPELSFFYTRASLTSVKLITDGGISILLLSSFELPTSVLYTLIPFSSFLNLLPASALCLLSFLLKVYQVSSFITLLISFLLEYILLLFLYLKYASFMPYAYTLFYTLTSLQFLFVAQIYVAMYSFLFIVLIILYIIYLLILVCLDMLFIFCLKYTYTLHPLQIFISYLYFTLLFIHITTFCHSSYF